MIVTHAFPRWFWLTFGALLATVALVACGDTKTSGNPTASTNVNFTATAPAFAQDSPQATPKVTRSVDNFNATSTALAAANTGQATQKVTRSVDNFNATSTALAANGPKQATPTVANKTAVAGDVPAGCPNVSASPGVHDVVCTFHDSQGHTDYLYYGRGNGHSGDFGWAHIKGKHINGIWYDGGIITTYPQAFGTTSDVQVLSLINKALQDAHPKPSGDRTEFRYKPSGSRYDVLAVVGSDGTIITAYPEG